MWGEEELEHLIQVVIEVRECEERISAVSTELISHGLDEGRGMIDIDSEGNGFCF